MFAVDGVDGLACLYIRATAFSRFPARWALLSLVMLVIIKLKCI